MLPTHDDDGRGDGGSGRPPGSPDRGAGAGAGNDEAARMERIATLFEVPVGSRSSHGRVTGRRRASRRAIRPARGLVARADLAPLDDEA